MSDTKEPTEMKAPTLEELQVQLKTLTADLAHTKSAQSGSDAAYNKAIAELTALKAENDRLAKEKMSAGEQAKFDLAKEKASVELSKTEVAEATRRLKVLKAMGAAKLPGSFENRIHGITEEEIAADITALTEEVETLVSNRVKDALGASHKPGGGDPPKGKVNTDDLSMAELVALEEKGELSFD